MTDAEMERLERMAQGGVRRLRKTIKHPGASNREKRRAEAELASPYSPAAVLALIERVRKAESERDGMESARAMMAERARRADEAAQWNEARARERNDFAERLNMAEARANDAERKGAEEMREKAEEALYQGDPLDERPEYAERIRSLPLPGDPT